LCEKDKEEEGKKEEDEEGTEKTPRWEEWNAEDAAEPLAGG